MCVFAVGFANTGDLGITVHTAAAGMRENKHVDTRTASASNTF